uniref:ATP synthase F0 subunit 8 n=1 Tax=Physunio superbus TaxID=2494254 RepID=A0A8A3WMR9_9BIVA|nr:ATP synthase F0 subunit 8 [Physunio superbus]QTA71662.1 ATP synthase F0 subunit 8 [Physunio superbus]
MPQLSPMSWEIVFMIVFVCWIFLSMKLWWSVCGDYSVLSGSVSKLKGDKINIFWWGVGKKVVKTK